MIQIDYLTISLHGKLVLRVHLGALQKS